MALDALLVRRRRSPTLDDAQAAGAGRARPAAPPHDPHLAVEPLKPLLSAVVPFSLAAAGCRPGPCRHRQQPPARAPAVSRSLMPRPPGKGRPAAAVVQSVQPSSPADL